VLRFGGATDGKEKVNARADEEEKRETGVHGVFQLCGAPEEAAAQTTIEGTTGPVSAG
jgi:hypothetical protein